MSGIADLLIFHGYNISGSDREASAITDYLKSRGATIFIGQHADNLKNADVLVYSSAIPADNPERMEAARLNIPQIRRAEMLHELMRLKYGIAIAGTHGKTTTTAMCGKVFQTAGLNPTIVVGGRYMESMTNAVAGSGEYLITEADEYDQSFLALHPVFAIITSLEEDHLECYGSFERLQSAFVEFANRVPFYGCVVYCGNDPNVRSISEQFSVHKISYGITPDCKYQAAKIQYGQYSSSFTVIKGEDRLGTIELNVPGEHNVLNALAVTALCMTIGIPFDQISSGLNLFTGIERRFQIKGTVSDITVVDDYAHHPTEVRATLNAAKSSGQKRIIAVFQPHLYSRTRDFYHQFAQELANADTIFLTEIYPARESPLPGISGKMIFDILQDLNHTDIFFVADTSQLAEKIIKYAQPGDLVLTMGAGDIWQVADTILSGLKSRDQYEKK